MNTKRLLIILTLIAFTFTYSSTVLSSSKQQNDIIQNYIDQGIQYGQSGQMENAIKEFEKILLIDPNNVDALNNLGVAYFRLNDLEKSLFYHTKAVEVQSSNPRIYSNRALLLGKYMYRDKEAIADYTKAINLDRNFQRAYLNRGLAYYFSEQYPQAISDFNKLVEINPESIKNVLEFRASAYYKIGMFDKSQEDIEKAKSLGIKLQEEFVSKVKRKTKKSNKYNKSLHRNQYPRR